MELKEFKEKMSYALGRFDWGNAALDADAIKFLNEWRINLDEMMEGKK